jgi:hypothetical protein
MPWILVSTGLSAVIAIGLILATIEWMRREPDRRYVVVGLSAALIYGGAWWFYTFPREYGYAVFKMAAWMQFMLMPAVAYGLVRLWDLFLQNRSRWGGAPVGIAASAATLLVVGGNLITSLEYGRKSLGDTPQTSYIINNFEMSGNYDYLALESAVSQFVGPGQSIALGFTDTIQNNWVAYYLRKFPLSILTHTLFPGDDENLPDPVRRRTVDAYGNVGFDVNPFFHGNTDDFYLLPTPEHLNSDILRQSYPSAVWKNDTFQLLRGADVRDLVVTGRGGYRLEFEGRDLPYWWPAKFRWVAEGMELYLLRPAATGQPYRVSFAAIAGYGANSSRRTVELWHNDQKFDEVVVDGSGRFVSAPFYPTGVEDRVVIKLDNEVVPRPRPLALWNTRVPSDYRRLNLVLAQVELVSPQGQQLTAPPLDQALDIRGIFESTRTLNGIEPDGWLREEAALSIARPTGAESVGLGLFVPDMPEFRYPYVVTVDVDGVFARLEAPGPGRYTVVAPLGPRSSAGDPLSIRINPSQAVERNVGTDEARPITQSVLLESMRFATSDGRVGVVDGIDSDGWMDQQGVLTVTNQPNGGTLELQVEYPTWAPRDGVSLTMASGSEVLVRTLDAGYHTLRIPLDGGPGQIRLTLTADSVFRLPSPDTRERSLRILSTRMIPS